MRRIGIRTWLHAIAAPHSLARLKVKKAVTSPARVLMLGFGALILLGALLLHLPLSSTGERLPFLDALFTATSAVCVTGLTVVDPGSDLTLFGQVALIALIQVGGLGFMTLSTLILILLRRRITLSERLVISNSLNQEGLQGMVALTVRIVVLVLAIEGIGAVLLTLCLYRLQKARDLWVFFISMIIGGVFEYVCSLVQEYAFGTVSWNYENSRSSIGSGRTNLLYAFFWGLLGLIWIKELYPRVSRLIEKAPKKIAVAVTWVVAIFMIFNITVSIMASARYKERQMGLPASNQLEEYLDSTYDDAFMKKKFPNAIRIPTPSKNKTT